jgi:pimeloyl-ACP methyl ester carboxylesterase
VAAGFNQAQTMKRFIQIPPFPRLLLLALVAHRATGADPINPRTDPARATAPSTATAAATVQRSIWQGFGRLDFHVDGRPCLLVLPRQAALGRPWIWRTEFFGHEPQADLALLAQGFHVAYLDVQNLYGAPVALDHMDRFYAHLTTVRGLSPKSVLEGFSRGGLFAFNWAARHPDRVACLYVDAPVCDFKSWPAGWGQGRGSPEDWARCKKVYGLTDEQARAYPLNPVDNLAPLAKVRIPILSVCGDADDVVPMAENTLLVQERYVKLGGPITVITKRGVGHHPHSLKDPARIVDFIARATAGTPLASGELTGTVFLPDSPETPGPSLAWPPTTAECRPWSYWWWMGSAVDATNLTRELQRYQQAGWGGVHIIPIYGAKGWEDRYLDYLSPKWMAMLRHTVSEARRLGLGVDMTTGTGWCFGGPTVSDRDANATVVAKTFEVPAGGRLAEKLAATQALVAFAADGTPTDLTDRIRPDGTVDWTASGSPCRVYAVSQRPSWQRVKRAAPGGAGHMLNLIFADAMPRYLERFTEAFAGYEGPKPRALYHDSYEYRSDWAPDFFLQFEKRRGYRLQHELPALFGKDDSDRAARVKCDYRETIADILAEQSLPAWTRWSHEQGFVTRNQAHGSPGNLLDLYAAADIPETEMFHTDRDILVSKFASSAAHVTGKRLVASETGTWLKEHFTETLADLKYLFDDLFLSGVNHVIYHGTCYSPDEAPWPGWLFYASTEMNPRNSIWRDVPVLNAYAARCQSILQSGQPANDILLYWPIHDRWHNPKGMAPGFTVHARDWLDGQAIGQLGRRLWKRGYAFDYVSDRQLASAKADEKFIATPGGTYRVVVVPACEHMPAATLEKLLALAAAGATVIFERQLPADVPGWADLESRRGVLRKQLAALDFSGPAAGPIREAKLGRGRVLVGEAEAALAVAGVRRETLTDHEGLFCLRRAFEGGRHYFIANRGDKPFDGWLPLATVAKSVGLLDPMTGRTGVGVVRPGTEGTTEAYVQLHPGESLIVKTFTSQSVTGDAWTWWQKTGRPTEVQGTWQVRFIHGGPELPSSFQTAKLASWTELGGEAAQRFAGTALYTLDFDAPAGPSGQWLIDLGKVCQSARVRLNGRDLGTVLVAPFRVVAGPLKASGNRLEVEVTSVAANRIRDLDRRQVAWRTFHDINVVNLNYKPFDAANWPLADSGLVGPVTLQPVVSGSFP